MHTTVQMHHTVLAISCYNVVSRILYIMLMEGASQSLHSWYYTARYTGRGLHTVIRGTTQWRIQGGAPGAQAPP